MNNVKDVRVGVMPGQINEYAVEEGKSIKELLNMAGLSAEGYDIKVDGVKVSESDIVTSSTNLVLLVKQVKGNADGLVRIGIMPGQINEYALEVGITIGEALEIAGLNADGYDVKMDGVKVDTNTLITPESNLVLLVKQVKGNR